MCNDLANPEGAATALSRRLDLRKILSGFTWIYVHFMHQIWAHDMQNSEDVMSLQKLSSCYWFNVNGATSGLSSQIQLCSLVFTNIALSHGVWLLFNWEVLISKYKKHIYQLKFIHSIHKHIIPEQWSRKHSYMNVESYNKHLVASLPHWGLRCLITSSFSRRLKQHDTVCWGKSTTWLMRYFSPLCIHCFSYLAFSLCLWSLYAAWCLLIIPTFPDSSHVTSWLCFLHIPPTN